MSSHRVTKQERFYFYFKKSEQDLVFFNVEASKVHPVDLALVLLGDEVPLQLQGRSKLAPGYDELVRQDGELPNQLSLECHK